MKKFAVLLSILLSVSALANPSETNMEVEGHLNMTKPYKMRLTVNQGTLGTDFNLEDMDNGIDVVIMKRKLRLFTMYDLYKNDGSWDATAFHRTVDYLNPLAWQSASYRSLRVKGADGSGLGRLEGTLLTLETAKFNIYDRIGKHVAVAHFKNKGQEIQINDAGADRTSGIATLKKKANSDEWLLSVVKPDKVDHRLLKFLAVYVLDQFYQEEVKKTQDIE